jgi:hypothetical protein
VRQECFVPAAQQYVGQHFGKGFTKPEHWTLDQVFEESSVGSTASSWLMCSVFNPLCMQVCAVALQVTGIDPLRTMARSVKELTQH